MTKVWPDNWPRYSVHYDGPCDMLVGPCLCGSWHERGEFTLDEQTNTLRRYGQPVNTVSEAKNERG